MPGRVEAPDGRRQRGERRARPQAELGCAGLLKVTLIKGNITLLFS